MNGRPLAIILITLIIASFTPCYLPLKASNAKDEFSKYWIDAIIAKSASLNSMALDKDNEIYLALYNPTNYWSNGFVVKFNGKGDFIWGRQALSWVGGGFEDICMDNKGLLYAVAAYSVAKGGVIVLKLNQNGDIIWFKMLRDLSRVTSPRIAYSNGGLYITGSSEYLYVAKIDVNGKLLWAKRFGEKGKYRVNGICVTPDGLYVAGELSVKGYMGGFIALIDNSGNLRWFKTTKSVVPPEIISVAKAKNGRIYVAVSGNIIAELNSDGKVLWAKALEIPGQKEAKVRLIHVGRDQHIYVAFSSLYVITKSPLGYGKDTAIFRLTPEVEFTHGIFITDFRINDMKSVNTTSIYIIGFGGSYPKVAHISMKHFGKLGGHFIGYVGLKVYNATLILVDNSSKVKETIVDLTNVTVVDLEPRFKDAKFNVKLVTLKPVTFKIYAYVGERKYNPHVIIVEDGKQKRLDVIDKGIAEVRVYHQGKLICNVTGEYTYPKSIYLKASITLLAATGYYNFTAWFKPYYGIVKEFWGYVNASALAVASLIVREELLVGLRKVTPYLVELVVPGKVKAGEEFKAQLLVRNVYFYERLKVLAELRAIKNGVTVARNTHEFKMKEGEKVRVNIPLTVSEPGTYNLYAIIYISNGTTWIPVDQLNATIKVVTPTTIPTATPTTTTPTITIPPTTTPTTTTPTITTTTTTTTTPTTTVTTTPTTTMPPPTEKPEVALTIDKSIRVLDSTVLKVFVDVIKGSPEGLSLKIEWGDGIVTYDRITSKNYAKAFIHSYGCIGKTYEVKVYVLDYKGDVIASTTVTIDLKFTDVVIAYSSSMLKKIYGKEIDNVLKAIEEYAKARTRKGYKTEVVDLDELLEKKVSLDDVKDYVKSMAGTSKSIILLLPSKIVEETGIDLAYYVAVNLMDINHNYRIDVNEPLISIIPFNNATKTIEYFKSLTRAYELSTEKPVLYVMSPLTFDTYEFLLPIEAVVMSLGDKWYIYKMKDLFTSNVEPEYLRIPSYSVDVVKEFTELANTLKKTKGRLKLLLIDIHGAPDLLANPSIEGGKVLWRSIGASNLDKILPSLTNTIVNNEACYAGFYDKGSIAYVFLSKNPILYVGTPRENAAYLGYLGGTEYQGVKVTLVRIASTIGTIKHFIYDGMVEKSIVGAGALIFYSRAANYLDESGFPEMPLIPVFYGDMGYPVDPGKVPNKKVTFINATSMWIAIDKPKGVVLVGYNGKVIEFKVKQIYVAVTNKTRKELRVSFAIPLTYRIDTIDEVEKAFNYIDLGNYTLAVLNIDKVPFNTINVTAKLVSNIDTLLAYVGIPELSLKVDPRTETITIINKGIAPALNTLLKVIMNGKEIYSETLGYIEAFKTRKLKLPENIFGEIKIILEYGYIEDSTYKRTSIEKTVTITTTTTTSSLTTVSTSIPTTTPTTAITKKTGFPLWIIAIIIVIVIIAVLSIRKLKRT